MKRIFIILIICIFILVSCGTNNKPQEKTKSDDQSQNSDQQLLVSKYNLKEARNKTLEDMTKITEAAMMYYTDNGSFPIGEYNDFLKAYYQAYQGAEKLPEKDAWGNPFLYASKTGENLVLASTGPDGIYEGTEDDDILIINGELTIGKKLRIK